MSNFSLLALPLLIDFGEGFFFFILLVLVLVLLVLVLVTGAKQSQLLV